MNLRRVGRPAGLTQVVRDEIENLIVSRNLPAGSKLPTEKEVADQLGVGRSSVREAMRALEEKGIIEVVQGKGSFVRNEPYRGIKAQLQFLINFEDHPCAALTELRLMLEVGLVRLAAVRADEEDLERLHEHLEKLAGASTLEEMVKAGANFHLSLVKAAKNGFAATLYEAVTQLINEVYRDLERTEEQKLQSYREHEEIYRAIVARDPELAVQKLEAHLLNLRLDPAKDD